MGKLLEANPKTPMPWSCHGQKNHGFLWFMVIHAMGIVISTCLKKCYTIYIVDLYTLYVKKKLYIHPYPCLWLLIDDHLPMLEPSDF